MHGMSQGLPYDLHRGRIATCPATGGPPGAPAAAARAAIVPRHVLTQEDRRRGGQTRWEQLKHGPDHGHFLWLKRQLRRKYKAKGALYKWAKL